jgi:GWxTD domain-containing protein
MKRILLPVVIFLLLLAARQNLDAYQNTGRLPIEADYAAFRIHGDSANAYVEIHYNISRSHLKYTPDENGYVALIDFRLTLKDTTGTIIDTVRWRAGNRIEKLAVLEQSGYLITDMVADVIPAGPYNVELEATCGDKTGRAIFPMEVPSFSGDELSLSAIEFAYEIQSVDPHGPDTAGRFVKNGIRVLPNPSHDFAREDKLVHFYAEGYGLDTTSGSDSVFYVALEILNTDGKLIKPLPTLSIEKPGESAVINSSFGVDSLDAGNYGLRVTLMDGESSTSRLRGFSVVVAREATTRSMLQGILNEFPEADNITGDEKSRKFRDAIAYIATPAELRLFDSLPLEGKPQFQKNFWARRDPDPSTPQNEYQVDHYKRFKYANSNFGRFRGNLPGWKTDRGRVFIIYGDPSEIERFAPTSSAKAWERWWYHGIEGGVYFIFVENETAGDYILIHSSKNNEIKDYNWEDKIRFFEN